MSFSRISLVFARARMLNQIKVGGHHLLSFGSLMLALIFTIYSSIYYSICFIVWEKRQFRRLPLGFPCYDGINPIDQGTNVAVLQNTKKCPFQVSFLGWGK